MYIELFYASNSIATEFLEIIETEGCEKLIDELSERGLLVTGNFTMDSGVHENIEDVGEYIVCWSSESEYVTVLREIKETDDMIWRTE